MAMTALTRGRTTFIIAHRLATVVDADLIVVLKDGRILERGSHSELMRGGGCYAGLVQRRQRGLIANDGAPLGWERRMSQLPA